MARASEPVASHGVSGAKGSNEQTLTEATSPLHPQARDSQVQPPGGQDRDCRCPRLQPQHPPLCGQHTRTGAGGRERPPHRRHPGRPRSRPEPVTSTASASIPTRCSGPNAPATWASARPSRPSPPSRPSSNPLPRSGTPSPPTSRPSQPGGRLPGTTSPNSNTHKTRR